MMPPFAICVADQPPLRVQLQLCGTSPPKGPKVEVRQSGGFALRGAEGAQAASGKGSARPLSP
eukprot:750930-Prorocentrum_minimum.AAC.1